MRVIVIVSVLLFIIVTSSFAGDYSAYSRAGIMDWTEQVNGKQIVREIGLSQEIGVKHKLNYEGVDFTQSIGTWLAELYYDGSKAETGEPYKKITGDVGLKANLGVSVPTQITDKLTLATIAGVDADAFFRIISGEIWVVTAVKTGVDVTYDGIEVKGGILYPFFTSDTADWSSVGVQGLITVHPKGLITPFMEMNVKITERWTA